jgi:sigma-E factor negative regulatory protein RseA
MLVIKEAADMKDKLKESVSALLDNEADELELKRILAQIHDEEVLESWQHYHQIRASLNSEEARWVSVDLRKGINAVLDEDSSAKQSETRFEVAGRDPETKHHRTGWWTGVAIAASVALAVIFTVQFAVPGQQNSPVVAAGNSTVNPPELVSETTEVQHFSKEYEARLNDYIMQHTGHAALNSGKSIVPFARLTSFEPESNE